MPSSSVADCRLDCPDPPPLWQTPRPLTMSRKECRRLPSPGEVKRRRSISQESRKRSVSLQSRWFTSEYLSPSLSQCTPSPLSLRHAPRCWLNFPLPTHTPPLPPLRSLSDLPTDLSSHQTRLQIHFLRNPPLTAWHSPPPIHRRRPLPMHRHSPNRNRRRRHLYQLHRNPLSLPFSVAIPHHAH